MLGLDAKDTKIRACLRRGAANASRIAEATGISRLTVAYRLRRMTQARLVQEVACKGRQRAWKLSDAPVRGRKAVEIYRDNDVVRAYAYMRKIPKKTVMYALEGAGWLRLHEGTLTNDDIKRIQTSYRRRGVTIMSLLHKKYLEQARAYDTERLKVYKKRSQ